jgi:hypothetical protein
VATAVAPLTVVAVGELMSSKLGFLPPQWTGRVLRSTLAVLAVAGLGLALAAPRGAPVRVGDRVLYAASATVAAEVERTTEEVDAAVPAGEPILIGLTDNRRFSPTPSYFYFLLPHRIPDAYYLELAPGVSERKNSRLLDDFRAADNLLLWPPYADVGRRLYPLLPRGSSQVNSYVRANFELVLTTGGQHLYRRMP